jgi:hypothetical protein
MRSIVVSFWFDDSKTRGAWDECHRQGPKQSLKLPKILRPVTEGTIFWAPNDPPACPAWGRVAKGEELNIPPNVEGERAELKLYRGGHMFYTDPQSRKAFTTDARTMYASP